MYLTSSRDGAQASSPTRGPSLTDYFRQHLRSLAMTGGTPGRQGHRGTPGPRVKPADESNRNELSEWYDWFLDRTSLGLLPSVWDDPGRRRSPRSRGSCLGIAPISCRAARSTRPPSTAGGPRTG